MKVSDRQWSVGDVLKVIDPGYMLTGVECTVVQLPADAPMRVRFGPNGSVAGLHPDRNVELVEFKLPPITEQPTIEQQAARLADARLREARLAVIVKWNGGTTHVDEKLLDDLERVDAEFAKSTPRE